MGEGDIQIIEVGEIEVGEVAGVIEGSTEVEGVDEEGVGGVGSRLRERMISLEALVKRP